jgi:Glycosyltransferase sugar-binding region containing DXD motif
MSTRRIPNRYHFVWYGRDFPFTHALAIRSAAATCLPDHIVLHASDDLRGQPHYDALVRDVSCLEIRPINIDSLTAAATGIDRDGIRRVHERFVTERRYAALSDLMRFLTLYTEGGVYLDLDTIAIRDLRPLLELPGFCGRELILVSAAVHRRRSYLRYFRTVPLDVARWICAHVDPGIRWFPRIAHLYADAINSAVFGLGPGHDVAREALRRIPVLASEVAHRRPAIGPDLMQTLLDEEKMTGITVLGPEAFYPLGPTMAAHYFRVRKDLAEIVPRVIAPGTYVVHWGNNDLRKLDRPDDPAAVRALSATQLFSHLAMPFLPKDDSTKPAVV